MEYLLFYLSDFVGFGTRMTIPSMSQSRISHRISMVSVVVFILFFKRERVCEEIPYLFSSVYHVSLRLAMVSNKGEKSIMIQKNLPFKSKNKSIRIIGAPEYVEQLAHIEVIGIGQLFIKNKVGIISSHTDIKEKKNTPHVSVVFIKIKLRRCIDMPKKCNVDAGIRLKNRQVELRLNNVDAGEKIGMNKKPWEELCAGRTNFRLDRMIEIDEKFGITPNELAYGTLESPYRVDYSVMAKDISVLIERTPRGKERQRVILHIMRQLILLMIKEL